ncbi:energy transducer TonB [Maribellus maritimus]|uniref:energy transducer TonB n=1 Tax=Maribellus maritimus TaxID=2870838 RepID=UPI001EEC74DF|nr:energy transducer TonB [Maribellus maritimus]MCG6190320.1 energy transducer TonB [Maribellus maritimus]
MEKNHLHPPVKQGEEEVFYIVEDMPHSGWLLCYAGLHFENATKIAQTKGIKGRAKVLFAVNAKGKVADIKIVGKDNEGAARGAVMLVSGMPDRTLGKQRGKAVPVKYLLPVEFK